jgi:hypothetical protein
VNIRFLDCLLFYGDCNLNSATAKRKILTKENMILQNGNSKRDTRIRS